MSDSRNYFQNILRLYPSGFPQTTPVRKFCYQGDPSPLWLSAALPADAVEVGAVLVKSKGMLSILHVVAQCPIVKPKSSPFEVGRTALALTVGADLKLETTAAIPIPTAEQAATMRTHNQKERGQIYHPPALVRSRIPNRAADKIKRAPLLASDATVSKTPMKYGYPLESPFASEDPYRSRN